MSSLGELASAHAPLLLLDAASARIQVGWWRSPTSNAWQSSDEEAGIGVFRCFAALGIHPSEVGAFVFCEGPGSILGIRTVAMAVRTWTLLSPRPSYAYSSLELVACALARPGVGVIADARRDSWHHTNLGGNVRRVPTAELTGELVMPDHFRHWSALPRQVTRVPYVLPDLLARIGEADVFRPAPDPDAFLHEEPSYVTWTPQVHRAP